jgi:membrane-associated protease RseP (regulator of RpoE activity)
MGPSPTEIPDQPRDPLVRYVILFLATAYTTTAAGASHYLSFYQGFGDQLNPFTRLELMIRGLWYSVPILAILGCHELGHYLACRYYGVAASRPYFIPMPLVLTGTLGAFIRIRRPIPGKRELFDIGIAGPIAGFVVAVPLLFMGMYLSRVVELPRNLDGELLWLGEPLLFKAAAWLTFGHVADGYTITMHPVAFAAWFGLLATALNLFPIGQLDGGHISYAVLGRKSTAVTLVMAVCLIGLAFWSLSWAVWAGLTVTMLVVFGPHHPPTADEDVPLDPARRAMAIFAVIMFILCFTPAPIELMDVVTPLD